MWLQTQKPWVATHTHKHTHTEPALATYTATRASYIAKKAFFHKQPKKASHTHIDGRADRISLGVQQCFNKTKEAWALKL